MMFLYTKYGFHLGEFDEVVTEYKGYRIEICFDEKYNRYEADAFDLEAQEYVVAIIPETFINSSYKYKNE